MLLIKTNKIPGNLLFFQKCVIIVQQSSEFYLTVLYFILSLSCISQVAAQVSAGTQKLPSDEKRVTKDRNT